MKLSAINKVRIPNFIKTLAIATPLIAATPLAGALVRTPDVDTFEQERVILIHETPEYSPQIKAGNKSVYPAVVVDKSENQLYFYDLDGYLDTTFTVGLGKSTTPTHTGLRVITSIESYPYSSAPKSTKRHKTPFDYGDRVICLANVDQQTGEITGSDGEFIHGTNQPASVGKNHSKGCVRMLNEDVQKLAEWLSPGQYVFIKE